MLSSEDLARVRCLLPSMKRAWGIQRLYLEPHALVVWIDPDDTTNFPSHIHTVPVELRVIGEDQDPAEMAA